MGIRRGQPSKNLARDTGLLWRGGGLGREVCECCKKSASDKTHHRLEKRWSGNIPEDNGIIEKLSESKILMSFARQFHMKYIASEKAIHYEPYLQKRRNFLTTIP